MYVYSDIGANNLFLSDDPIEEYHFIIVGHVDGNNCSFTIEINPNTDLANHPFLKNIKKFLEHTRTLQETDAFVNELFQMESENLRQLAQVIRIAADRAWVDHFLENIDTETEPDSED